MKNTSIEKRNERILAIVAQSFIVGVPTILFLILMVYANAQMFKYGTAFYSIWTLFVSIADLFVGLFLVMLIYCGIDEIWKWSEKTLED